MFDLIVEQASGAGPGGAPFDVDSALPPEVAHHVGSCLACFRVVSELREVPRTAALLRRAARARAQRAEPGLAFWDALAARTVDAASAGGSARAAVAEGTRADARAGSERRAPAVEDARRPWLAALLGAAVATAALVWLFFGHAQAPPAPAPPVTAALVGQQPAAPAPAGVLESEDELDGQAADVAAMDAPEMVEQIAGLDGPALRRLAQALARTAL